jgi:hypothetical protein
MTGKDTATMVSSTIAMKEPAHSTASAGQRVWDIVPPP